jgi:hypothetical protein
LGLSIVALAVAIMACVVAVTVERMFRETRLAISLSLSEMRATVKAQEDRE